MNSLPLFHRIAGQPVIVLGAGEAAAAKARLVERAGGEVIADLAEGIDRGARLAFIAHDQAGMAEADALRARCAGLLVNVVDRPTLCDFTVPSLLERGPVLVAVGTGGVSAGLAKALRLRLEGLLPQGLGALAEALGAARAALRSRWPDPKERRVALDTALAPGGVLDPLGDDSAARVTRWLGEATAAPLRVTEFAVSSDDPDDLTLRTARALGSADCVAHEPGVADAILLRARADAARRPIAPGAPAPAYDGAVVVLRRA